MVIVKRFQEFRERASPEEELAHHGIKGQKWGVRNGPPYPLDKSDYSKSEREASGNRKAGFVSEAISTIAILAAMYGLSVLSEKRADARKTIQYEEEYYNKRKIKSLAECPRIDPSSMTMEEHMQSINPDYPGLGTVQNCMFCTTAMAMRMKGYDVIAEKCPDGWSTNNIESTWEGFISEKPNCRTISQLENYLVSQGEGAYGNLVVFWVLGGGHSMFYKVDNDGLKLYDTQSNQKVVVQDLNGSIVPDISEVIRLDNKEPTEMILGAVKTREEKKA